MNEEKLRVAVVQAASVFADSAASTEKAVALMRQAAGNGAELIVFPEAFLSGYPRGITFGTVVGSRSEQGRELFARYQASAITIPGPETRALAEAAREAGVFLAMGVIEKDAGNPLGTLYCTLLYIDESGTVAGKHRKIKPTAAERIIWGEGDGSDFQAYNAGPARVAGLICWENYMPLARMALYEQGVTVYLAPTADNRDSWLATVRHIACEGRCYVLSCNQFFTPEAYPEAFRAGLEYDASQPFCRGGSAIISPAGEVLCGPVYDKEEILYADLDLTGIARARFDFDAIGHYNRPDIFEFRVK